MHIFIILLGLNTYIFAYLEQQLRKYLSITLFLPQASV